MKSIICVIFFSLSAVYARAQWTNGTNIYNTNSGGVSIGTTSAVDVLTISTAWGNGAGIYRDVDVSANGAAGAYLNFGARNGSSLTLGAAILGILKNATTGSMRFYTSKYGFLSPRMTIDEFGHVGVGTTTPLESFTVLNADPDVAGLYRDYDVTTPGNAGTYLNFGAKVGAALTRSAQISAVLENPGTTGYLTFATLTSGNLSTKMLINSAGNVGIGTTSPDQMLTVNGTIHSKAVKIDLTIPGPDYVFNSNYDLPSLSEVKSYISKNHHLSDIPSAKAMSTDGLDGGAMNLQLLKKVEELTLYVIKQKEDTQKLKSQLGVLNKKVATLKKKLKSED